MKTNEQFHALAFLPPIPNMGNRFTHLHLHTIYSTLDGMCKIEELFKRADEIENARPGNHRSWNNVRHSKFLKQRLPYNKADYRLRSICRRKIL